MPATSAHLAFNTAVSFVTNTNWQSYGGESTLGYLVQMAGLTVQNFVSAATGIVLAVALVRGFTRAGATTIGNFWADLVRCTLYVLLPLSHRPGPVLRLAGRAAELSTPTSSATTLEGGQQVIAQGPVASQEAIKMLGTNGGGFFNANSAHPYENPTPLANFVQMLADLRDRRRPDQPVRPHGRRRAPGLGDPGRHGRAVHCRRRGGLLGRGPRQPRADRASASTPRAATWKARRSASASWPRPCSPRSPPPPPAVPSTPCTPASCPWAAWSR